MKHGLEPGVLRVVQLIAVGQVVALPILRRVVGASLGIEVPIQQWLALSLGGPLLLVIVTWTPWAPPTLGRAFFPLVIIVLSVQAILEKYLTLMWLIAPPQQELDALLLAMRLWLTLHTITLLVAWQNSWRWVVVTSLALIVADAFFSWPFMNPSGSLYSISTLFLSVRAISVVLVALGVNWLVQRQREQQGALAEANRKLALYAATAEQLAVSQERNRLARELHDTLAHSLSGVTVQLGAVQALWHEDEEEAQAMLAQALEHTRHGLVEARRALQSLRASPLEDLGLALAVQDLAETVALRARLNLDLTVSPTLGQIAPEVEQGVYRIAQEALTNVTRHAQATSLHVALGRVNGTLSLTVADDGQGFETAQVDTARYGLAGMQERAATLGGLLDVTSQPQQGTTVRLTVQV